jgi:hypothetical protein
MQRKQTSINITETNGKLKRVTTNTRITQESALARSRRIASQNSTLFRFALSGSIFILFFGLLLGVGTTEYYQDNAQTLQWIDSNGEFIEDSYNLQVTISNQTPLDDLNGLTLNELFIDNNINNDNWVPFLANININNDILTATSTGTIPSVYQINDYNVGDYLYMSVNVNVLSGNSNIRLIIDNRNIVNIKLPLNQWTRLSAYTISINNVADGWEVAYRGSTIAGDQYQFQISDLILLNLSNINLEHLTQQQIDYYFDIWKENQQNRNLDNYYNLGNTVVSNFEGMNDSIFQPALRIYDSLRPQIENVSEGVEMIEEGWKYIFSGKLFSDLWKEIFN